MMSRKFQDLPDTIDSLRSFYAVMNATRDARRAAAGYLRRGKRAPGEVGALLAKVRSLLDALPATEPPSNIRRKDGRWRRVSLGEDGRHVALDLRYEMNELEKDTAFLSRPLPEFSTFLPSFADDLSPEAFEAEREKTVAYLRSGPRTGFFVADRDGTINNYCGRYLSSIQSVYNALFVEKFAATTRESVILTSAPLAPDGLVDVSVVDQRYFVLAGSKGRDMLDRKGIRHRFPIAPEEQRLLDRFNRELSSLLSRKENEIFSLIGSGLQFKFGQTTVAYQDISESIESERAARFTAEVYDLVDNFNRDGRKLFVEDTGKDLEIILTASGSAKEFDKGDGLAFIDRTLGGELSRSAALVCGDTASDIPMLAHAVRHAAAVKGVFVTRDDELKARVQSVLPDACFVAAPDILVTALGEAGREAAGGAHD
mgnify:CR=1 FL=1